MSTKTIRVHRSVTEINENQWNNVVEQSDRGTVFQRTEWLRAVEDGLGRTPRHLVVTKDDNPVGVFPHFLVPVDLPDFVPAVLVGHGLKRLTSLDPGFGGPLFVGDERSNFEVTFDNVDYLFSDTDAMQHLLIPADGDFARYASRLTDRGYRPTVTSCRFVVDLRDGWEAVKSGMDRSKRANLADASQSPATVAERRLDDSVLRQFYETYAQAMERVDGTTYPFEFFESLAHELGDRVKLFTVHVDGEFAGGQLYLLDDERSAIHEFFRGLDAEFFEYYPTELLGKQAMQWGIEHGYDEYDLGRTSGDFTDGSFTYKAELGADIRPILAWERGYSPFRWQAYRIGRWILRNAPETDH